MTGADRFKLLGKYRTPRCRIGQTVRCQVRGEVVTGVTRRPSRSTATPGCNAFK
jgi:hypothetical protein